MSNPFDYVNSITTTKKNMMRDTENDALSEADYNPFMVNKSLSYFIDTLLHANEMNMNHDLGKRPQYEFLLNSVRRKKRFAKWSKAKPDHELTAICEVYSCSRKVAEQYRELMSKEDLKSIMKLVETGGTKKK